MLGESSDICTLRQGLRTVEVAAAVLDSASSGRTVWLDGRETSPEGVAS